MKQEDRFAVGRYRDLIDWGGRLRREAPFLEEVLGLPPSGAIVDLGCGSGEHARWLAWRGWTALGLDTSPAQIESARRYENEFPGRGPRFFQEDILRLPSLTKEALQGAICIGNVLPYFEEEELGPRLRAVCESLAPGAPLLLQLLNYQRLRDRKIRTLPMNLRPDPKSDDGEIVWLRLLTPLDEDHFYFHPVTLDFHPGHPEPVVLRSAREIRVRSWTWPSLESLLLGAGFSSLERYGGMERSPFIETESHDLVIVARRSH